MELNDVIKLRRSIRKFKSDPVPDSYIRELLEAARLAPSGVNLQPWRYIIVKSEEARQNLAKATPLTFLAKAPVIIVCCTDTQAFETRGNKVKELQEVGAFLGTSLEKFSAEDYLRQRKIDEFSIRANLAFNAAISIEHIVLRATDLGLGTCWIGMFDEEKVRKVLDIDDRYSVVSLLPVGYPDQEPAPRPRLMIDEILLKEM